MRLVKLLRSYREWLDKVWTSYDKPAEPRTWCSLGLPGLSIQDMTKFFDREALNAEYKLRYNEDDIFKKKPFTYIGTEIDSIFAMQKGMVARHRTRMQTYRDDAVQKRFNTKTVMTQSEGEFLEAMRISDYPVE